MNLLVGNIVTVDNPEWRFHKKQGRVEFIRNDGNEDGPVGVRFPSYYGHLFQYPDGEDSIVRFEESDLKLTQLEDGQDIEQEKILDLLFGRNMYMVWYTNKHPLMIGFDICDHEDCEETVRFRIMVNNHGTVVEYDVCVEHTAWHGRNCDGFPYKRPEPKLNLS